MLGQTGPSWLSASQSFLCGELHQAGQVVLIPSSSSSHAQLDSMVLSPFVEVLRSRPSAQSLTTRLGPLLGGYVRYAASGGGSRFLDQAHTSARMMCT